jgi:hypothetical protein
LTQLEIWSLIAQTALNYIFVSVITSNNQKQTILDMKTDLRTTKEDIMSELKDSRKNLVEMLELIEQQQSKGKDK